MGSRKRPAAAPKRIGRPSSCDDLDGLRDGLNLWVVKSNFVTYTSKREIKYKDIDKLKLYLPHLRRLQRVDRTWNFSLKTINDALLSLNQVRVNEIV